MPTEFIDGKYVDVPWGYPDLEYRGLGKFSCELDERLYYESLDGWWDSCGSTEDIGFHCRIPIDLDLILDLHMAHFSWDMRWVGDGLPVGAILEEDDRGFVGVAYYFTEKEFEEDWEAIQKAERDFYKCETCNGTGWGKVPNGIMGEQTFELRPDAAPCKDCEGEGYVYS